MYDYENMFTPKGWVCPKCGRVYSPTTSICSYCNNQRTYTITSNTSTKISNFPPDDYIQFKMEEMYQRSLQKDKEND